MKLNIQEVLWGVLALCDADGNLPDNGEVSGAAVAENVRTLLQQLPAQTPIPEQFRLRWEIDISADEAKTPREAAEVARAHFLAGSQAFDVTEWGKKAEQIDLCPGWDCTPAQMDPLAMAAREVVRLMHFGADSTDFGTKVNEAVNKLAEEVKKAGIEI